VAVASVASLTRGVLLPYAFPTSSFRLSLPVVRSFQNFTFTPLFQDSLTHAPAFKSRNAILLDSNFATVIAFGDEAVDFFWKRSADVQNQTHLITGNFLPRKPNTMFLVRRKLLKINQIRLS